MSLPKVYYGAIGNDGRPHFPEFDDEEDADATPSGVAEMLGFDPDELFEEYDYSHVLKGNPGDLTNVRVSGILAHHVRTPRNARKADVALGRIEGRSADVGGIDRSVPQADGTGSHPGGDRGRAKSPEQALKFNPYHEPAGSRIGGRFASKPGGGGGLLPPPPSPKNATGQFTPEAREQFPDIARIDQAQANLNAALAKQGIRHSDVVRSQRFPQYTPRAHQGTTAEGTHVLVATHTHRFNSNAIAERQEALVRSTYQEQLGKENVVVKRRGSRLTVTTRVTAAPTPIPDEKPVQSVAPTKTSPRVPTSVDAAFATMQAQIDGPEQVARRLQEVADTRYPITVRPGQTQSSPRFQAWTADGLSVAGGMTERQARERGQAWSMAMLEADLLPGDTKERGIAAGYTPLEIMAQQLATQEAAAAQRERQQAEAVEAKNQAEREAALDLQSMAREQERAKEAPTTVISNEEAAAITEAQRRVAETVGQDQFLGLIAQGDVTAGGAWAFLRGSAARLYPTTIEENSIGQFEVRVNGEVLGSGETRAAAEDTARYVSEGLLERHLLTPEEQRQAIRWVNRDPVSLASRLAQQQLRGEVPQNGPMVPQRTEAPQTVQQATGMTSEQQAEYLRAQPVPAPTDIEELHTALERGRGIGGGQRAVSEARGRHAQFLEARRPDWNYRQVSAESVQEDIRFGYLESVIAPSGSPQAGNVIVRAVPVEVRRIRQAAAMREAMRAAARRAGGPDGGSLDYLSDEELRGWLRYTRQPESVTTTREWRLGMAASRGVEMFQQQLQSERLLDQMATNLTSAAPGATDVSQVRLGRSPRYVRDVVQPGTGMSRSEVDVTRFSMEARTMYPQLASFSRAQQRISRGFGWRRQNRSSITNVRDLERNDGLHITQTHQFYSRAIAAQRAEDVRRVYASEGITATVTVRNSMVNVSAVIPRASTATTPATPSTQQAAGAFTPPRYTPPPTPAPTPTPTEFPVTPSVPRNPPGWLATAIADGSIAIKAPGAVPHSLAGVSEAEFKRKIGITAQQFTDVLFKDFAAGELTNGTLTINLSGNTLTYSYGGRTRVKGEDGITRPASLRLSREMTLGPNGKVYHSLQSVYGIPNISRSQDVQGGGTSKRVFDGSMDLYDHLGVPRAEVSAALDNGGFTWLRYGFVPDSTWQSLRSNAMARVNEQTIPDNDLRQHVLTLLRDQNPVTAIKVAAMKQPVPIPGEYVELRPPDPMPGDWEATGPHYKLDANGNRIQKTLPVGMMLFTGLSWHGNLSLTNPTVYSYTRNYIRARRAVAA